MSPLAGPIGPDPWVQNANAGRAHRSTQGTISASSRISSSYLDSISARISPHDHALLVLVRALRLISSEQIARLVGAGEVTEGKARVMRRRLERLTEWRLLDRLPRSVGGPGGGSSGWVYCLGPAGRRLLMRQGLSSRRIRTPGARFVDHTLAISEIVVQLTEADRTGELYLLRWDAEPDCWVTYAARFGAPHELRPDLFASVGAGDEQEDRWWLEIDRATESLPTIRAKCRRYVECISSGQSRDGVHPRVLWVTPTDDRADRIRDVIQTLRAGERGAFTVATFPDAVPLIASEAKL